MALKFKLKTKEEISAEHLSHYAERDGGWVLRVDGTVDKSNLNEFRTTNVSLLKVLTTDCTGCSDKVVMADSQGKSPWKSNSLSESALDLKTTSRKLFFFLPRNICRRFDVFFTLPRTLDANPGVLLCQAELLSPEKVFFCRPENF
ncbi:MAG: hypothetical protein EXS31_17995 [Pedosphaera sp.]|nr:hypothetical protein [Pedosphaera sp.]